jgi:hypothetical protein
MNADKAIISVMTTTALPMLKTQLINLSTKLIRKLTKFIPEFEFFSIQS